MTIELSEYVIDAIADAIVKKMQEPKFIAKSDGTIEQIKNCDDCIFRKEWEKIGKLLSVILKKQTEQEPCEDAIDRKLVCAFIDGLISDDGEREKGLEYIRHLPPVTPKPKTDVLDKIRAEIKDRPSCMLSTSSEFERGVNAMLRQSLMIIDKYKAESEG